MCHLSSIGGRVVACVLIATASYLSFYPIMFLVPAAIHIAQLECGHNNLGTKRAAHSMLRTTVITLAVLAGLLYASFILEGGWSFLRATYGFMLVGLSHWIYFRNHKNIFAFSNIFQCWDLSFWKRGVLLYCIILFIISTWDNQIAPLFHNFL